MSQSPHPDPAPQADRGPDPWAAFGYLVAGVGFYGGIGWGLATWLHAPILTAVGIVFGLVLALVLVFRTVGRAPEPTPKPDRPDEFDNASTDAPHDQGETE